MARHTLTSLCLAVAALAAQAEADEQSEAWQNTYPLSLVEADGATTPVDGMPVLTRQSTVAADDQVDPLMVTVSVRFDADVISVGDAAEIIVEGIGYELMRSGTNVSPLLAELLDSPLPKSQRSFDHLRVREALRALAGIGHVAVVDHVHRKVTFDPRPLYRRLGQPVIPERAGTDTQGTTVIVPVVPLSKIPSDMSDRPAEEERLEGEAFALSVNEALLQQASTVPTGRAVQVAAQADGRPFEIIVASPEATRLTIRNEEQLREIEHLHRSGAGTVRVQDCSVGVPTNRVAQQRWLIGSALQRLSISRDVVIDEPCGKPLSEHAGRIVHVMSVQASGKGGGS